MNEQKAFKYLFFSILSVTLAFICVYFQYTLLSRTNIVVSIIYVLLAIRTWFLHELELMKKTKSPSNDQPQEK